jgi:hypothetical protein
MAEFDLKDGSREGLAAIGRRMDEGFQNAVELAEKVLTVRNRQPRFIQLAANPAQLLYAEKSEGKQRNIVLKARQMGITTWVAGQFFLNTITHPGTVTVQVAHTQEAAEQIFRIVHRFFSQLPDELRSGALKSVKLSARHLLIPDLDSEYLVETAGDRNAGRGLTITNLHCTELARWPGDAGETLCGLMATLSPEGRLVMESTPMGASGCFWKEWQDADRTDTQRHFFPWWLEPAYAGEPVPEESLTEEERKLMEENPGVTRARIAFRRQIRDKFRGMAKQEYAENADSCFLASGSCYFDLEAIDRRLPELPEPVERRMQGDLLVWFPAQPGHSYIVAVDPAGGGTAGDFTAMQVIDSESGLQCAELRSWLDPRETAAAAAVLAREYNNALLAVERNSLGLSVLTHLEIGEKYANIYSGRDGLPGFLTSVLSRPAILGDLEGALVQEPRRFVSERLLRECRCFVRLENGRLEAKGGEHDDLVLAMAIALQARKNALEAGKKR